MSSLNFGTFGEIGISSTRPGYIGKEKDGESQTGDYGARHYDELSGRFLSVDPLWASFPDQTPYQYGYNNPVMYRDPSGMSNEKPINGSSKGGGSHTCSRCGQPKNNNDNDSPLNPGNHICGGGTQFGSSDAYAARINSEFSALANKNSGETSGGRTMVIGGEKVESGSGGRSGKNGNKNPPAALSAKTGRGNDIAANPSNFRQTHLHHADQDGAELPQHPRPWMRTAQNEMGVSEIPGPIHNDRVLEYHQSTWSRPKTDDDGGPWCSSFLNWVMETSGLNGSNSARSLSWLGWGQSVSTPVYGGVGIINYGKGKGHVGIIVGQTSDGKIVLLGGNQGDKVQLRSFSRSQIVDIRIPNGYVPPIEHYSLPILKTVKESSFGDTR